MEPESVQIPEPSVSVLEDTVEPTTDDLEYWTNIEAALEDFERLERLTQVDTDGRHLKAQAAPRILSMAGHRTVQRAYTQRGVVESGGPNRGVPLQRYVRHFWRESAPQPWCAFFVSWCLDTSVVGNRNKRVPWSNPGYVGSVYEWARNNRRLVQTPAHGDMFGSGDTHMGLVVGANPKTGTFFTIEGNHGDRVAQVGRNYRRSGFWFARLRGDR